ncbi:MAG: glutathione S-transferase [Chitinophagales bacterium]|jgi:glutathione S-transferase
MSAHIIWSSELSPYAWKISSLLQFKQQSYRLLPNDGSWLENLKINLALVKGKKTRSITRYPQMTALDEYPTVPYLITDSHIQYDSSSIARWLDASYSTTPVIPTELSVAFVANLIDEAYDEFGLYMAHHMRWVTAAQDNDAGERLSHEFRRVLPLGLNKILAKSFPHRQVRRLPYLFSIAPPGYQCDIPAKLTPPAVEGFPATHALLDIAWREYLAALENIFTQQAYLLGDQFTVADASVYGQLYMNMSDPSAANSIKELAPVTHQWLININQGQHVTDSGRLFLSPQLSPLLAIIGKTFTPLMTQNALAFSRARQQGEAQFNEIAFDNRRNIYSGKILGLPFKSVAKSFQTEVWKDLQRQWSYLSETQIQIIHSTTGFDISQLFRD